MAVENNVSVKSYDLEPRVNQAQVEKQYKVNPNAVDKTPDRDTVQFSTAKKIGVMAAVTTAVVGLALLFKGKKVPKSIGKEVNVAVANDSLAGQIKHIDDILKNMDPSSASRADLMKKRENLVNLVENITNKKRKEIADINKILKDLKPESAVREKLLKKRDNLNRFLEEKIFGIDTAKTLEEAEKLGHKGIDAKLKKINQELKRVKSGSEAEKKLLQQGYYYQDLKNTLLQQNIKKMDVRLDLTNQIDEINRVIKGLEPGSYAQEALLKKRDNLIAFRNKLAVS